MTSSSESEDETLKQLKESLDVQFLCDDMYKTNENEKRKEKEINTTNITSQVKTLPSLRRNADHEDDSYNFFKVTPEFQKHVAKHLSKSLDNYLVSHLVPFTDSINESNSKCNDKSYKSRVKLLKSSKHYLKVKRAVKDNNLLNKHHKDLLKVNSLDEPELYDRCKSVAISGNEILNKNDVKSWSTRFKQSKLFTYKKHGSGELILDESKLISS